MRAMVIGMASAVLGFMAVAAPDTAAAQACNQDRSRGGPSWLQQGISIVAGAATEALSDQMRDWGVRPNYRFRSTLNAALTDGIACILSPGEREQAAAATNEVLQAEVGSTVQWESETRPGVSGSSTVLAVNNSTSGGECRDVRDVAIINGEETTVTKRMCRRPGQSGYQVVQAHA